jgi:hypothetical protein
MPNAATAANVMSVLRIIALNIAFPPGIALRPDRDNAGVWQKVPAESIKYLGEFMNNCIDS